MTYEWEVKEGFFFYFTIQYYVKLFLMKNICFVAGKLVLVFQMSVFVLNM